LPLQELAKEPFGRVGISVFLNEDVDHIPVLIDGPPEIVPLAPDVHEQLVQMPDVSPSTLPTSEVASVV
jgi:hypothetical protein